ncbi:glycosyl transferase [Vibrio genomosp. F10 str. ZF-129]|uniref:Glycosyl transferase n=1 Tax=Vibrio genomosp. F10 str. ZF-129 TaxID=1187848 RepID=A0A1E5BGG1_9VIBR|nr:glycosyl transferase [Vibrio genomosp. F10 str. ZF-129]
MNTALPEPLDDKRVWLIIDSLTFGGIETHVFELAKGLKVFDVNVTVVFVAHYGQPALLSEKLEQASIPFFYLNHAFPARSTFQSLTSAIVFHKPILIHAHGYKASIYTRLARFATPKVSFRHISTYHAGETPKGRVKIYDFVDRYTSMLSHACLSVSDLIKKKIPTPTFTLNNFIDTADVSQSKGSEIAFVGRMSIEKAPDRFLDLSYQNPQYHFHCYGSGPMETELKSRAPANLVFHGHQTNMDSIWQNIELLVIPSRYEGLPMAALEAMARGIPILCTNVGDLNKLIEHDINGFITNNEAELNQYLALWISKSESERASMKVAAIHKVADQYSTHSVLPQILAIYQI